MLDLKTRHRYDVKMRAEIPWVYLGLPGLAATLQDPDGGSEEKKPAAVEPILWLTPKAGLPYGGWQHKELDVQVSE